MKIQLSEGLSIKKGNDGYWMNFESSDGKRAVMNLNSMVEGKRIIQGAVLGWADDIFKAKDISDELALNPNFRKK